MKVSSCVNDLLKKHCNIDNSFINDEDQYIPGEINGTSDIVLEAKRLILKEQIDKIIDINLCDIENEQIKQITVDIENPNQIYENLITINYTNNELENKKRELINHDYLQKYFKRWKDATKKPKTVKKIEDRYDKFFEELEKRQKTLKDEDKLNTSSVKINNKINKKFENRYNAQAKIILSQKYKLLEQEKEIEELKYGKVREELLKSIQEHKQELSEVSTKVSIKTKCKLGVIIKDKQTFNLDPVKVPKVIREMEKRAQEREVRREQIRERKRLIEEERRKVLLEAAENKRIQDEEEKRRNLEAIKERRRKELEIEKRKREERLRLEEMNGLADDFYGRILKRKVLQVFKNILVLMEENEYKSRMFYEVGLERRWFLQWKINVEEVVLKRNFKAIALWRTKCLRKSFEALKENCIKSKQNNQVASDFYDFSLTKRVFRNLHLIACKEKMRRYKLCAKAVHHYNSRILLQYFYQWKSLPIVLQLERAKEEKKRKWREKVMDILPDYKPISYDDDYY